MWICGFYESKCHSLVCLLSVVTRLQLKINILDTDYKWDFHFWRLMVGLDN